MSLGVLLMLVKLEEVFIIGCNLKSSATYSWLFEEIRTKTYIDHPRSESQDPPSQLHHKTSKSYIQFVSTHTAGPKNPTPTRLSPPPMVSASSSRCIHFLRILGGMRPSSSCWWDRVASAAETVQLEVVEVFKVGPLVLPVQLEHSLFTVQDNGVNVLVDE